MLIECKAKWAPAWSARVTDFICQLRFTVTLSLWALVLWTHPAPPGPHYSRRGQFVCICENKIGKVGLKVVFGWHLLANPTRNPPTDVQSETLIPPSATFKYNTIHGFCSGFYMTVTIRCSHSTLDYIQLFFDSKYLKTYHLSFVTYEWCIS